MNQSYCDYAVEKALKVLSIDSPTGFTDHAIAWTQEEFQVMGYETKLTNKGGLLVDLGGTDSDDGILLTAHIDTLGAMVAEVKQNGRLRVSPLGGMHPQNSEGETVLIYKRDGKTIDGTLQLCNPSSHVNGDYTAIKRDFENTEIVIDEDVNTEGEARALGIEVGDPVCFCPRSRVTESGYIKSRFLDDKLCVGILISFAKYLKDHNLTPARRLYYHISVYEEVGHGGGASVPVGVTEVLSVDMGCVGDGLKCKEQNVSICAKDSHGPYSYQMIGKLIDAAKQEDADYVVDIFPHYGSDADVTVKAGFDVRHGLVGPGIYASHGYERAHKSGVLSTLKLLKGYLFPNTPA